MIVKTEPKIAMDRDTSPCSHLELIFCYYYYMFQFEFLVLCFITDIQFRGWESVSLNKIAGFKSILVALCFLWVSNNYFLHVGQGTGWIAFANCFMGCVIIFRFSLWHCCFTRFLQYLTQMGVCDCFKRISCTKKKKEDTYHTNNKCEFLSSSKEVFVPNLKTEEVAATQIQTAFRAYKAKKRLNYLRVISRFQALNNRNALAKQASSALDKLHFWSKIQAQISARHLRMKQMKLEERLKVESKLNELQIKWSGGAETIEENKLKRQQLVKATNKRERALAYAFSHQWRANSNRYFGQAYYDLSKESWGWNWIEQWIAVYRQKDHVVVRPVVSATS